ncbi:MAG TPA: sugar phosphorylase [Desulfobacteraceae bacterium]|nr:sugar phosphorylase [Desulfobacteraceae bacterium]
MNKKETVKKILTKIYGDQKGLNAFNRIIPQINRFPKTEGGKKEYFSHEDIILITYGDTLNSGDATPLNTLSKFADKYFAKVFSAIHILPFYPFSSDDGFSVIDFLKVDPNLGTWDDVADLNKKFDLMFDLVLNHISAKSPWFDKYLKGEKSFMDLAMEVDPSTDLSKVTRPRSLPLLTEFTKKSGEKVNIWTTFSEDQVDLNFRSLDVLEKMINVLLWYVQQGAKIIRLDAIAYLWKEIGTSCIHLSSTHEMVKLFRAILNIIAHDVIILTETNVPHDENTSYFGDGDNEAQMVYNFTLPPLLLHTLVKGDASILSSWAKGLQLDNGQNTFFNFTASHDGIGVRPLEGILPADDINRLVAFVKENGGSVSYKKNSDGTESPYELNITYIDACRNNASSKDPLHIQRFLCSQAIQYSLPGVPATYIHSILGSRNWTKGVEKTGRPRSINREKLQVNDIISQLKEDTSFRAQVFSPYIELIKIRKSQKAFHPNGSFEIMEINPKVFAIKRYFKNQIIISLTNISSKKTNISLPDNLPRCMENLFSQEKVSLNSITLNPYQYIWLSHYQ